MTLHLQVVRLGSARLPGEGVRIGAVRYLPRGVRRSEYAARNMFDVWLPTLAPSRELLKAFKGRGRGLSQSWFFRRYRAEMAKTEPKQVILLLSALARRTPISVGCYCEDEAQCHRSVLEELILAAAR
jgi:uncharacterized protein YeaO (DUF488 family)